MRVYHLDPITGAFASEGDARPDPMEHERLRAETFERLAANARALHAEGSPKLGTAIEKAAARAQAVPPQAFLCPAHATFIAPPAPKAGFDRVFRTGAWELVPEPVEEPPPPPDLDALWAAVRAERDRRLAACDWTQLADTPLSEEERATWRAYRQNLRELPNLIGSPLDIVQAPAGFELWPAAPQAEVPE
jgi:hypothetical protein